MKGKEKSFLQVSLFLVALFAVIFFGAARPWAVMVVCASLFFLLFLFPKAIFKIGQLPLFAVACLAAVLGFIFLQIVYSSYNNYATSVDALKWLACLSAFVLTLSLNRRHCLKFLILLSLLGAAESLYALYQIYSGHEMVLWKTKEFHRHYATGTYFNRNHLAGFFQLSLGASLGLWLVSWRDRDYKGILGFALLIFVMFLGFVHTGSRMGLVSFCMAALVLSVLPGGLPTEIRFQFFSTFFISVCLVLFFGWDLLMGRMEDVNVSIETWDGGRFLAWRDALTMLKASPWWGIGLGNFGTTFRAYQSEKLLMGWAHAHNDYLQLVTELGIPAFVLLLVGIGIMGCVLLARLGGADEKYTPFVWGCLISLTSLSLHGLSDFNWAIPANSLLTWILLAIAFKLTYRPASFHKKSQSSSS